MIGIFGGAFDPPHKEHIAIARGIAREYALEKVIFLPSGNSPHKTLETPFSIRAEMLGAAIGGFLSIGEYKDANEAVKNMVRVSKVYEPNLENAKVYDDLFENAYKKMYPSLKKIYSYLYNYTAN